MDANKIRPNLWIGSFRPAIDPDWLRDNNIAAVLNLALELDDPPCDVVLLHRRKLGINDGPGNTSDQLAAAIQMVIDLLGERCTLLVHCVAGNSRTPYIVAKALALIEGRTYEELYAEIRAARPSVVRSNDLYHLYG